MQQKPALYREPVQLVIPGLIQTRHYNIRVGNERIIADTCPHCHSVHMNRGEYIRCRQASDQSDSS